MKKQIKRKIYLLSNREMKPIEVVQYETGVQLIFEVQDTELDTTATATLFVRKPSGKFVFQEDNISLMGNTVVIDLHNQAITEYGHPFFQIKFKKEEEVISTYSGMLTVEKSLDDSGAEESKTFIAAFNKLTDEEIAKIEEATQTQIDLMKAEIEAKGEAVLATIPDDYIEMQNRVNILFNSVANAIKGTVSGSVVRVDDVSPVEHKPVVKVHGKNIFNPEIIDELYEANGLTIARSGDKIIINGTSTKTHSAPVIDIFQPITKGETYTCTIYRISGVGSDVVVSFGLGTKSGIRDEFYDCTSVAANVSDYRVFTAHYEHLTRFLFYFREGATFTDFVCKIQLEKGGVSTEYTPYIDPTTITISRLGKNLLQPRDNSGAGYTATVNEDGSITVTGAANTTNPIYLTIATPTESEPQRLKAGQAYKMQSWSNSGKNINIKLMNDNGDAAWTSPSAWNSYLEKGYLNLVQIYIESTKHEIGDTSLVGTYKIMLEAGNTATEFEAFKGLTEYTPNTDGTVAGLTSESPTMTLLTDTEGITLECEYNKDTGKVIDNLTKAVVALGGNV